MKGEAKQGFSQVPNDHVLNNNLAGIMEQLGKYKDCRFIG